MEIYVHTIWNFPIRWDKWSASLPGRFNPRYPFDKRWVSFIAIHTGPWKGGGEIERDEVEFCRVGVLVSSWRRVLLRGISCLVLPVHKQSPCEAKQRKKPPKILKSFPWWCPHCTHAYYTVCPTRYRTRPFFNNSNINEDIATKFEQKYVRCVRNEKECVCSVCL